MRKFITITHVTLNGIMQSPGRPEEDPTGGFTQGGWIMLSSDDVVGQALDDIWRASSISSSVAAAMRSSRPTGPAPATFVWCEIPELTLS